MPGQNRQHIRPDFIRRVSVGRDTVRAGKNSVNFPLLHQRGSHVVADQGRINA